LTVSNFSKPSFGLTARLHRRRIRDVAKATRIMQLFVHKEV
jgi:hypothetical protein